ncbi:MarR family winged helix-turn-helix transcriptional regulator [Balneola vulgaris]|uniref:MarR family winged helix-turn-helix transcriptional regulator n=1 Tax=Balneola vulgaris TaxID=287535 RepID=UPI000382E328|nr:MarR family transcriptional regulator [Balneola vulgaris]
MPTHYKGSSTQVNTLNAYIKMMRASESIMRRLCRSLSEVGLTISQFGVLESLLHLGPQNQKEIGTKLLKSGGNITLVIDNLEKNGYVKRKKDDNDRRALIVSLTAKGEKFISEYFPKHLEKIEEEFNVLSETEKKELARICKKVGMKAEELAL